MLDFSKVPVSHIGVNFRHKVRGWWRALSARQRRSGGGARSEVQG